MSFRDISREDSNEYFKIKNHHGFDLYLQADAYFMVSNFPKLTIDLIHLSYGDFLTIKELEPSLD